MPITGDKINKDWTGSAKEVRYALMGVEYSKSFFEQCGWTFIPSQEGFSAWDAIFRRNGKERWIEAEVRGHDCWSSGPFPSRFNTMHVPARKTRSQSEWYFQFSMDGNQTGFILMENVKKYPTIKIWCSNTGQKEDFFDVPKEDITFVSRKDGVWDLTSLPF